MLVLAIWLFLIGYSVAITGKRNLAVSYSPQSDGSIKPVDDKGNPARTYSLMDVVSCAGPGGAPAGTPGSAGPGAPGGTSGTRINVPPVPTAVPGRQFGLVPGPNPLPTAPGFAGQAESGFLGVTGIGPGISNLETGLGLVDQAAQDVHHVIVGIPVVGPILQRVFGL